MNTKKLFLPVLITVIFCSSTICFGQQQVMFTQYMFNGLVLNPAYAGSHETVSVTAMYRKQWVGLEGAPSTQTFSIHSPVKNERIGLGLLLIRDKIAITDQYGGYLSYSYTIPLANGKLSFGLQGGFNSFSVSYSEINVNRNVFNQGDINEIHPNAGAGLYYYTDRFYLGGSSPQLIERTFDSDNPDSDSQLVRHYFLSSGYVLDLKPDGSLKLKPNVLVKMVQGAPVEFDVNLNVLLQETVWIGASWRSFDSFDALLRLQVTDRLQVGYAYDFLTTTDLSRVNSGSHEISLNYRFLFDGSKIVTPRYF